MLPEVDAIVEPEQTRERVVRAPKPIATDRLLVGYKAPGQDDADWAALEIVATLLAGCPSARLYRRLVIEREAASSVDAQLTPFRDPSLLRLAVTAARGHSADEILAVDRRRDRRDGRASRRTRAEVEKAKAIAETDFWTALVDVDGKAEALGHYETALGDFRALSAIAERLAAVTADDVARVVRAYLVADAPHDRDRRARARRRRRRGRRLMPVPSQGLTIVVEPSPDTPLVWFDIAIRGGASADPRGVEGLHRHAALLARRGAGAPRSRRSSTTRSTGSAPRSTSASAATRSRCRGSRCRATSMRVVELAADILAEPRFDRRRARAPAARDAAGPRRDPRRRQRARDALVRLAVLPGPPLRPHVARHRGVDRARSIATPRSALWRREVVADNLVIGARRRRRRGAAAQLVARLTAAAAGAGRAATPAVDAAGAAHRRAAAG